jgi:hypothetical protein
MADVLGRRYLQLQNRVRRNGRERWTFLRGTDGSNPAPSTGESKAISWIMAEADAKKLAGATPITGFGRLLRKH